MGWNLFEGTVYGFPVSGDKEGGSIISMEDAGPAALTGGAYGPEGGALGIAASLAGIALILLVRLFRRRWSELR